MPPGMWHSVYTPLNTLATAGHFIHYDALPLMEMSRFYDVTHGKDALNARHPGINRTLARMTLALRSKSDG